MQAEIRARQALQLARESAARDGRNPDVQSDLADALLGMSMFSDDANERSAFLSEAVTLREAIFARRPSDPQLQRNTAVINKHLGASFLMEDDARMVRAGPFLKRAADLDEVLARQSPNDPAAKQDFAIDLSMLADYCRRRKDLPGAIRFTERSPALKREIAAANPKDDWARDRLAWVLVQLGDLQLEERAPRAALASFQEAIRIGGHYTTRASALAEAGAAYRELGNAGRSCAAYAQALALWRTMGNGPLNRMHASYVATAEKGYAPCIQRASNPITGAGVRGQPDEKP